MPAASSFDDEKSCFPPSNQVLVGQLFFLLEHTIGCAQIWHRRCDKDWLQEGGTTPSPPLSLHLTQFSLPKCWPAYITWTDTYPIYPPFSALSGLSFQLQNFWLFLSPGFSFSVSFLREYSCLLKMFECSCVLDLLVGCVNGTQPRVLGSKSDFRKSGISREDQLWPWAPLSCPP